MDKNTLISTWLDLLSGKIETGSIIELPVLSGSMMPLLIPGKNIKMKYAPDRKVNTGDIIIFREGKKLTAHRVLFKIIFAGKQLVYQKGDMNRFGSWITKKRIIGVIDSVQDINEDYISLNSASLKKRARLIAYNQILSMLYNILLIIPRKIKEWSKAKKMNTV